MSLSAFFENDLRINHVPYIMTGTIGTTQKNAIFGFDMTLFCEDFNDEEFLKDSLEEIEEYCKKYCKKYVFQAETCPSTGKVHIQMRISLKVKARKPPFIEYDGKCSPTSKDISNVNFFDYCSKDETSIPDTRKASNDEVLYIPRQIRDIKELYPWQQSIIDNLAIFDTRSINWLYCPSGNIGKSTLTGYCRAYKIAKTIPMINDYKDLMGCVIDMKSSSYLFDFPRAMKKDKINQIYSAIESIKDGYAFDTRYKYRELTFDCPNIWIFSNTLPDYSLLSSDRWKTWIVNEDKELITYKKECGLNKGLSTDSDED